MLKTPEYFENYGFGNSYSFKDLTKLALIGVLSCSIYGKDVKSMDYSPDEIGVREVSMDHYPYNMRENRDFFVQNLNYLVQNIGNNSADGALDFIKNYPGTVDDMLYILKNGLRFVHPENADNVHLTIQIVYSIEGFQNKVPETTEEKTYTTQEEDNEFQPGDVIEIDDIPEASRQMETWD
ncbi:hypothetical protein [Candidatus Absconditicoccus praedator]|uniref:hypothetical protein n=1 Tax=Candidatus Absconditicoccus praedator TaxID=2735562 RepID=UPI001E4B4053|nr:hypothetical protein [Candidatus Absconditicoccus praedator]UFX82897.1 hypothetical protein HLG78_02065 [Candidatus Absconditicoccus praedator]